MFQSDFEQPYEPMSGLSYWNPISGTKLILMMKDVQCPSWGWQKSLFTLLVLDQICILENRMFASHTRVHTKKIHRKEITSV